VQQEEEATPQEYVDIKHLAMPYSNKDRIQYVGGQFLYKYIECGQGSNSMAT
jgi:hypothetical protein